MKILLFDIETTPMEALVWDMYETNVIKVLKDWYILSFSYKWLGEKTTHVRTLPDYKLYKKDPTNDHDLVKDLWQLFNEADVVIGHNGDRFDIRKSNARFIKHGLQPTPPLKTIDTLKIARKHFKFNSNRLDALGEYLGIGRKEKTGGIDLWVDCMNGDMKAWKLMAKYNKQDVVLLEEVYLRLRPWMTNHPNRNVVDETTCNCPLCGGDNLQKRGFGYSQMSTYQRYFCRDCYGWSKGPTISAGVKIRQ